MRNPIGQEAKCPSGTAMGIEVGEIRTALLNKSEVLTGSPHKHPGSAACHLLRNLSCILEGLPGQLKQEALLGIHVGRFAR